MSGAAVLPHPDSVWGLAASCQYAHQARDGAHVTHLWLPALAVVSTPHHMGGCSEAAGGKGHPYVTAWQGPCYSDGQRQQILNLWSLREHLALTEPSHQLQLEKLLTSPSFCLLFRKFPIVRV